MKVLLVTGKLASKSVIEIAKGLKDVKADVLVLDYPVASLMTVDYIAEKLKSFKLKDYDYIIVPGLVSGDTRKITEITKIKTYKGTKDYIDIPALIEAIKKGIELSTILPADNILSIHKSIDIKRKLEEIEENGKYAFEVENLKIPIYPPPFRIFIEIDATKPEDEITNEIRRVSKYVDVIVLGFPNGHNDFDEVRRKVKRVVEEGFLVGIDSASTRELIEGVKAGAHFVFNLNEENIDDLTNVKEVAFVVAPLSTENKAEVTLKLYKKAKERGFEKLILDPILSPPLFGLVNSIIEYKNLREKVDAPLLMGILNVTELIDADSVGVNTLLTSIAGELGVGNLLVMDNNKTRWSSYETKIASQMISLALDMKTVPKDLGIDLLILKDKKRRKSVPTNDDSYTLVSEHIEPRDMDKGYVRINVSDKIYLNWKGKDEVKLSGFEGLSIGRKLLNLVPYISPEHALYIGYELAKAEIALQLDKNYIQDEPLFKRGYNSLNTVNNKEKA